MSENKPLPDASVFPDVEPIALKRIIVDADFQGLQAFVFKAMALQHEKPELADLFTPEQVADVRILYELLGILQQAKAKEVL